MDGARHRWIFLHSVRMHFSRDLFMWFFGTKKSPFYTGLCNKRDLALYRARDLVDAALQHCSCTRALFMWVSFARKSHIYRFFIHKRPVNLWSTRLSWCGSSTRMWALWALGNESGEVKLVHGEHLLLDRGVACALFLFFDAGGSECVCMCALSGKYTCLYMSFKIRHYVLWTPKWHNNSSKLFPN